MPYVSVKMAVSQSTSTGGPDNEAATRRPPPPGVLAGTPESRGRLVALTPWTRVRRSETSCSPAEPADRPTG
jgi:hypothetical protein